MSTPFRGTAVLSAVVFSACATTQPHKTVPNDLGVGSVGQATLFEQQARGTATTHDSRGDNEGLHKALLVVGIVAAAVGTGVAIGFGAAGQVTQNQLDDAYREGVTRAEESDFQDRGEAFNTAAIVGAGLGVAGLALTAVMLGLDFSKCGRLGRKYRDRCTQ